MLSVDAVARREPADAAAALSDASPSYQVEPSYHYVVSAAADPGLLPRTLELLAKRGMVRAPGEPLTRWARRLSEAGEITAAGELLGTILPMHYRYRFDPAGIGEEERGRLETEVQSWLDRNGLR